MHADRGLKIERQAAETPGRGAAHAVAADLEAIFRGAPRPAPSGAQEKVQRLTLAPRARRDGRVAGVGVVVAAALGGLAIGLALMDRPHARDTPPPPPRAPQIAMAPAPAVAPAAPAVVPAAAAPPARRAVEPRDLRPTANRSTSQKPARQNLTRVKAAARHPAATRCDRLDGDARARCAYPAVMAADRRLRQAYAQATRAGVSRAELVTYRNRWASLRYGARHDPMRTIDAYGDMAQDLDRMARQARS